MGEICLRCGNSNIKEKVLLGSTDSGSGGFGLQYKHGLIFNLLGKTEKAWCDLCIDCGEITRFYVFDTDHEWWTKYEIDERKIF